MSAGTCGAKRVFLIDAIESAFDHRVAFEFVRALFRVLESIDATPVLASAVQLRLFIRKDLVEGGIQNREQFEARRRIDLVWDVQTIFNFVLSRIAAIDFYRAKFPDVVEEIARQTTKIREGSLPVEECEKLLLRIFPQTIKYKNINTLTFLRTYFSDEGRGETSFYPRVYLVFLEQIAKSKKGLVKGHIDGTVIAEAHQYASGAFVGEVSQELAFGRDMGKTKIIFEGLAGKATPFEPNGLAKQISDSGGVDFRTVREHFEVMRQLGIFEEHPKRLGYWRAGRLFKTGLRMRFAKGG